MTEIGINPGRMRWGEATGYVRGTGICALRTDQSGMVRAFLLRTGQDFTVGGHTNTTSEQHLVPGGEIHSGMRDHHSWEETVDVKTIEREIEGLPTWERSLLITRVMFDLCEELLGEDACRDQLRELFGIDCLEKLEKRLETGI